MRGLTSFETIRVFEYPDRYGVYQAFNSLLPDQYDHDGFVLTIREKGVMASVHYPDVLPEVEIFKEYSVSDKSFPVSREIADSIFTLPLFGSITE